MTLGAAMVFWIPRAPRGISSPTIWGTLEKNASSSPSWGEASVRTAEASARATGSSRLMA